MRFENRQEIRGRESQKRISMTKPKRKRSAASLKNLVPGANLRHGAFRFLRTGVIPPEHSDIAEAARCLDEGLHKEYCAPGNFILNEVQKVPIAQLLRDYVFSELLITYLWRQVGQAGSEGLGKVLALSVWDDWDTASNRVLRGFRDLNRNLRDFGEGSR